MITGVHCWSVEIEVARFLELFYKTMDDRKLLSPMYSGLGDSEEPPLGANAYSTT